MADFGFSRRGHSGSVRGRNRLGGQARPSLGRALVAGGHLAATGFLASYSLKAAALFGIPALVLTLLISWLAARYLEVRAQWRSVWAVLAAICCALIAGFLCGFLFRLSMWAPAVFAATTDVVLILFLLLVSRRRKPVGQ